MKANAPDKLYLSRNIYGTYLYQVPDPDDDTVVEYIRTDAFIEKVQSFLNRKDDRDSYTIGYIRRHLEEIIKEIGL